MNRMFDKHQQKSQEEAKNFVLTWFQRERVGINIDSLYVVWFAYISNGYKCMVSSHEFSDLFFEVTKHRDGEMYCECMKRFEHFVKPSDAEPYTLTVLPKHYEVSTRLL